MSGFALVVSDVDGTLVTGAKTLTARSIEAVGRLYDKGIRFSICSSRPPFGLSMLLQPLRLSLPFAGFNGAAILTPDMSPVEETHLSPEAARLAVELLEDQKIGVWLFNAHSWFVRDPLGDHVEYEIRTIKARPTPVRSFAGHFGRASKIVGASNDLERVAACEMAAQKALAGLACVVRSQPYYLDVTPPGTSKGRLVELLSGRLGIPREEIAVLGDMENDLEMFKRAGFAIAMGNAAAEVKSRAQAITLSNEEDGFAVALERYVLG